MIEPTDNLGALQAWFQGAIQAPDENRVEFTAQHVLPSRQLTSEARLAIYQQAYFARLVECLSHTFPTVAQLLGEVIFATMAHDYLQQFPSRSYTLNDLGRNFPGYLEATRPDGASETEADWYDFVVELSRFDLAIDEVFDGPGDEREKPFDLNGLRALPPEAWENLRLDFSGSARLLRFQFPVNDFFRDVRAGNNPLPPARRPTWVALCRREWVVRRIALTAEQCAAIELLQAGLPLSDALARASVPIGEVADCFAAWTAAGLFRGYRLDGVARSGEESDLRG